MLIVILFALIQSCAQSENLYQKLVHSTSSKNFVADKCQLQLNLFLKTGVEKPWTSKMKESWSSFQVNTTSEGSVDFGNFDQCMSIHQNLMGGDVFDGQYCMVQFYNKTSQVSKASAKRSDFNFGWKNMDTRFGGAICIPASCSPEVIKILIAKKFKGSDLVQAQDYDQNFYCKKRITTSKISNSFIALVCVTSALLAIAVLALFYDLKTKKLKQHNRNQLILSFSPYTNALSLFNFKQGKLNDSIGCLHGFRVFSTLAIVLFHSVFHRVIHPAQRVDEMSHFSQSTLGLFIFALKINVDTFFVMSGCLVSRSILKDLDRNRFNVFKLLFQRYMRLTPSLAFIILVSLCSGQYLVQHAPYALSGVLIEPCERHWLSTLLHLQVYINPKDFCMLTTWYLSVEWQMFVLAPLVIYPCWKVGQRILLIVLPILVLVSFGYAYIETLNNHILVKDHDILTAHKKVIFQVLYIPTHVRGSAFLIGMILGYFMSLKRDVYQKFFSSTVLVSTIWTAFIVYGIAASTSTVFKYWNHITSPLINSLHLSSFRIISAVAISWSIFALEHGSAQKVNDFLSHRFWIPLGKLGLSIYLVHPVLQNFMILSQKQPDSLEPMQMISSFCSDLILTVLFSLPLYLLVEEPLSQLARVMISTSRADQKQTFNDVEIITSHV